MEVEGVQRIFMFVSDFDRSRQFYTTILGKPALDHTDTHAEFDLGGVSFLIHSDTNAHWLPAGAQKGVGTALHLRVSDIDAQHQRLKSAGVELKEEPQLLHTGIRKFAMKDPDGYEIEFVELPKS